ncbi:MAG TPA: TolC family protein [Pelobium sp.]
MSLNLNAQNLADTLKWNVFFDLIKQYHPVAQQSQLLSNLARAKRLKALGGFDPKIEASFDQKYYGGTEYYTFLTPQIKLPLWYGMELKSSYSLAEGNYVNPESKTPKDGLAYAGINFELGKGLFIDERRMQIRQAQLFSQASENEKKMMLNDLFLEAGLQYIDWHNKFKTQKIYEDALALANVRFKAVKLGFINGDKPAIDTLEALLTVQQRETQLQQAKMEMQNAKNLLANYLWLQNNQAIDADKLFLLPQDSLALPVTPTLEISNNPKIISYAFKIKDLNIERRMKAENLKPELGLQLGILNQGQSFLRNINSAYWADNNKLNINFSFPLTLSKARGDLAETKIKIKQTELAQNWLENEILNKVKQNNFELAALQNQLTIVKQSYQSSLQLLKGEEKKFALGESSLFLINSRESKLIEVLEKKLAIEAKLEKAKIKSFWLTGTIVEII